MRLYDYTASANCFKVRLLLGFLGLPCERVETDIFAGDTLTDAYGTVNPLREVPALELDDGRRIAQSNAILWYLAVGTPWLLEDRYAQGKVAEWLSFEQERVMSGIGGPRFRLLTERAGLDDAVLRARLATGRSALARLEEVLAAQPFLLGDDPSIADLSVFAYTHLADEAGLPLADRPAVAAWCDRIRALPGYDGEVAPYPPNARPGSGRSIYD